MKEGSVLWKQLSRILISVMAMTMLTAKKGKRSVDEIYIDVQLDSIHHYLNVFKKI
jgi:hypothetical protein